MLNKTSNESRTMGGWPSDVPIPLMPLYATAEIVCCVLSIAGNAAVIYVFVHKRCGILSLFFRFFMDSRA